MRSRRWLALALPLLLISAWELAVVVGWLNRIFYPPPSEVLAALKDLLLHGQLLYNLGISLLRIALGLVLGGLPGVIVGLLIGTRPLIRLLVQPITTALYPVPKIALLPLIIVMLGVGERSKIMTLAISIFFLITLNVAAGVLQLDVQIVEVARCFGARPRDVFWTVVLPATLPNIMTSFKLGLGLALTLIVGVEFTGATAGIGWVIWHAYELYMIDRMVAGLIVVGVVGWLLTRLLDMAEARLMPWQRHLLTERR